MLDKQKALNTFKNAYAFSVFYVFIEVFYEGKHGKEEYRGGFTVPFGIN